MRDELEYVDDPVEPEEEPYRSSGRGSRKLYERSVMRLFVDGRLVAVPDGFGGDVKTPKGVRLPYRVQVDADDEEGLRNLFAALEGIELRDRNVTVEHEVDGAKASYRVVRMSGGSGGHGSLHGELVEGEPVVFDGYGRRVPRAKDPSERYRYLPVDANEAMDILARYGLDDALSPEDDAGLWAAALGRYWPDPGDPDAPLDGMVFIIGFHRDGGADPKHVRHGLVAAEAWRFERDGDDRLRAVSIGLEDDDPRAPEPGEDPFGEGRYPLSHLDVERPSAGRDSALVHAGSLYGPLAGSGATRRWRREPGAGWRETEEPVSFWIS